MASVIDEVIEHADDDGAVLARLTAVALPENIAAIIDHLIDRLDADRRALLETAAVCGVDFRAERPTAAERGMPTAEHD